MKKKDVECKTNKKEKQEMVKADHIVIILSFK